MESKNQKNLELLKSTETLYTCHLCNKTPTIMKIDYINNEIELKCEDHQITKLKIKDYLNAILKPKKCQQCFKECVNLYRNLYNPIKYCVNCKLIICNNCSLEHINSNHIVFNNEEYNIKCKKHLNNFYEAYCHYCRGNICKECKKSGTHFKHNKFDFIEMQPNKNDFDIIEYFDNKLEKEIKELDYNKNVEALEKQKKDRIFLINSEHQRKKNEITNKFHFLYQQYLNKLMKEQKSELESLNLEIEKLKNNIINELNKKKQEFEINKKKIERNKDIIELHKIIINSYKKQGEHNLIYNENIKSVVASIKSYKDFLSKRENFNSNLSEIIKKYGINIDNGFTYLKAKNDKINNELINIFFKNKNIQFKEINISSKNINSLDFLKSNSENLKHILIVDCPIIDINILTKINFKSLIELKISNAKINNINALAGETLNRIKILNLCNNEISNINILQKVKFSTILEELYLNNNQIKDISVFKNNIFPKLKVLFLSYNLIEDIFPIRLVLINSCQQLSLEYNQIFNITLFKDINMFNYLKNLSLEHNLIDINDETNKKILQAIKEKKINFQY